MAQPETINSFSCAIYKSGKTEHLLARHEVGARTMEIGPIRNQNLIFWPLVRQQKKLSAPTDNQIYTVPANQFSPSAGTTLPDTINIARGNPGVGYNKYVCSVLMSHL